ncbi:MAG: hypothetical protein KME46_07720 [Brasilonema angustatum HA4187-MV1]|jgi:hypothetical protein|nr:hypothetical protein [Brasilonema angustatum HA4187-MV1]
MLDAKLVCEVLEEIRERAAVLIVSDVGAARGNFDQERVDNTKTWIVGITAVGALFRLA